MSTIIEAEPGDAVISTASGRVLLNQQGKLSLLIKEEAKAETKWAKNYTEVKHIRNSEQFYKVEADTFVFLISSQPIEHIFIGTEEILTTTPRLDSYSFICPKGKRWKVKTEGTLYSSYLIFES